MPLTVGGSPQVATQWRLDIDQDLAAFSGNFLQVKGANVLAPTVNLTTQDTTDYDVAGWGGDAPTLRKAQVTGTVFRKLYSGAFDPGQEFMRTCAENLSIVHCRYYERFANGEAYEGLFVVGWEPQSGDPTALITSNFTLFGQGARTTITNPFNVGVVPIVTSVSPVTGTTAGGTPAVSIFGSGLSGAIAVSGVKFGATNATSWYIVNDAQIVAIPPAHASGAVAVVVTNATGPSTTGGTPYTYV